MRISDDDQFWSRAVLAMVPDVLIGAGVAYATSSGILGAIGTIAALQIFYAALWSKNRFWNWALYRLTGDREKLQAAMLQTLRDNRLPNPDPFFHDVTGYFQSVMSDQTLACDQRIKAAAELAVIQRLPKFDGQLRLLAAWEEALDQYRLTFPAAQPAPHTAIEAEVA